MEEGINSSQEEGEQIRIKIVDEPKKSFFEWAGDMDERNMESNLEVRLVFLDMLENKPEIILGHMEEILDSMLLMYMAYNPIVLSIYDIDDFNKRWLEYLKNRFLSQKVG
ncbi:MAG: hypothetical protein WCX46_03095 [Candidatus Paceibacterota bacterium]